jgi:hypothetical protein
MDVERNWTRIGWGVVLLLGGVMLLLNQFIGLPPWLGDYNWWALIVIALGTMSLIRMRDTKDVGTGVLFVLLGGWFLVASNRLFGLTWHNSWPLALVATGTATIAKGIASRWLPDRRERWGRRFERKEENHA